MSEHDRCERDVIRAAREGRWTDVLRGHVANCEECTTALSVSAWMDRLSQNENWDRPLPAASAIWVKAQLMRGNTAADRASRPVTLAQWVAYFVVAAGWAGVMTWKWSALQQWLLSFTPTHMLTAAPVEQSLPVTFFAALVVLTSVTMLLALHTILAEE